jgi:hypothetical protein
MQNNQTIPQPIPNTTPNSHNTEKHTKRKENNSKIKIKRRSTQTDISYTKQNKTAKNGGTDEKKKPKKTYLEKRVQRIGVRTIGLLQIGHVKAVLLLEAIHHQNAIFLVCGSERARTQQTQRDGAERERECVCVCVCVCVCLFVCLFVLFVGVPWMLLGCM